MSYESETACDRTKARAILTEAGELDQYDPLGDYYLSWDSDGGEWLTVWGQDEPLVFNDTGTSWTSPGYPAEANA